MHMICYHFMDVERPVMAE